MSKRKKRTLTEAEWEQCRTAYTAGTALRELARIMGIPSGTILSRAKREGWTEQIRNAKALTPSEQQSKAIAPADAVAISIRERGEKHRDTMTRFTEKLLGRLISNIEKLPDDQLFDVLDRAGKLERLDAIARRNYGLDETPTAQQVINIGFLSDCSQAKRANATEA